MNVLTDVVQISDFTHSFIPINLKTNCLQFSHCLSSVSGIFTTDGAAFVKRRANFSKPLFLGSALTALND